MSDENEIGIDGLAGLFSEEEVCKWLKDSVLADVEDAWASLTAAEQEKESILGVACDVIKDAVEDSTEFIAWRERVNAAASRGFAQRAKARTRRDYDEVYAFLQESLPFDVLIGDTAFLLSQVRVDVDVYLTDGASPRSHGVPESLLRRLVESQGHELEELDDDPRDSLLLDSCAYSAVSCAGREDPALGIFARMSGIEYLGLVESASRGEPCTVHPVEGLAMGFIDPWEMSEVISPLTIDIELEREFTFDADMLFCARPDSTLSMGRDDRDSLKSLRFLPWADERVWKEGAIEVELDASCRLHVSDEKTCAGLRAGQRARNTTLSDVVRDSLPACPPPSAGGRPRAAREGDRL